MTSSQEFVTLCSDAREAATSLHKGARSLVGLAGRAHEVWCDPGFETVSTFVRESAESKETLTGAVNAAQQLPELARRAAGLFSVSGQPFTLPALPAALDLGAQGAGALAGANVAALVPGLSLGVGLLSLGVGVYNTVQLRRVGAKLDVLHSDLTEGLRKMDDALAWQSHQITRLVVGQDALHAQLALLRQEQQRGFERVLDAVQHATDRRIADEYHQQVSLFTMRYRKVSEPLAMGESPKERDLQRLLDIGETLLAWTQPRLAGLPPGAPARLPYLVAQVLATRACADVNALEDGRATVDRDVTRMIDTISREVFALCDGRDLFWIGVEVPELIAQYVYLARGLVLGQLAAVDPTNGALEALGAPWDDGLAPLRSLAARATTAEPGWLPLGTLPDLAWYTRWTDTDPNTADLRDVRAVNLTEVARRLGLPGRPAQPTPANIATLLATSLPEFREQALARLMLAFNWSRPPSAPLSPCPELAPETTVSDAKGQPWGVARVSSGKVELQGAYARVPVNAQGDEVSLVLLRRRVRRMREKFLDTDVLGAAALPAAAGRCVLVMSGKAMALAGEYPVPYRVLAEGTSLAGRVAAGSLWSLQFEASLAASVPTIREQLKVIERIRTRTVTLKEGFHQALAGSKARTAAAQASRNGWLKDFLHTDALFYFSWSRSHTGSEDSGLVLGERGGCVWTSGSLHRREIKPFAYGRSGPSVCADWDLLEFSVDGCVCFFPSESDAAARLLASLAAIFATLDLHYDETE